MDILSQHLLSEKKLSESLLIEARQKASSKNQTLIAFLIENQFLNAKEMAEILSRIFGLEFCSLENFQTKVNPLEIFEKEFILQHQLLPLEEKESQIITAISDPNQLTLLEDLSFHTSKNIKPVFVEHDLLQKELHKLFFHAAKIENNLANEFNLTEWLNQIISQAIEKKSSDIHLEPFQHFLRVRFRIDGILHEITQKPAQLSAAIVSRLKIMANLNIAEKRLPQDGRFTFSYGTLRDCRLSVCPTQFGEKCVIRILESNKKLLSIEKLGMNDSQKNIFLETLQKPQGLILVTGPTGSGKTISLYTALDILNSSQKNICTIEDPIEIDLPGINQVNIHPKIGLTFAHALRSFLRQDPDIMMVGEIRDAETAQIAFRAAQTGHLVLSTLHTNSAKETITRLEHLGIPSFDIAETVQLIIAQRLVRKLCPHCKQKADSILLIDQVEYSIYEPGSCDKCTDGYSGRTGIYELMTLSQNKISADTQTLRTSAMQTVKNGITSLAEIKRVIGTITEIK